MSASDVAQAAIVVETCPVRRPLVAAAKAIGSQPGEWQTDKDGKSIVLLTSTKALISSAAKFLFEAFAMSGNHGEAFILVTPPYSGKQRNCHSPNGSMDCLAGKMETCISYPL